VIAFDKDLNQSGAARRRRNEENVTEAIMRITTGFAAGLGLGAALVLSAPAPAQEVIFLSTQLRPIEEAQKVRQEILKDFEGGEVEFVPENEGPFTDRIIAEAKAGRGSVGLVGGQHGDLPPLLAAGALADVDDVMATLGDREFNETFVDLGKLGADHQVYVPWMQATYIMAADKRALEHLPEGADLNALTYEQLVQWAANVEEATGDRRLGLPAGPKGLMHRFLQGYLYPSYTGGLVRTFKGDAAVKMWEDLKALWAHANPRSASFAFMQEPLLAGEVWIAWDHTARLLDALRQRPDDFVAFPAPAGPEGRGFMPVVAGLAIPKTAPNPAASAELIKYLTSPEVQIKTLQQVGFYPVIEVELPRDLDPGIRLANEAITAQAEADDAIPSLLPVGLGERNGEFNKVFLDAFQRIVLRGQDISDTLEREGQNLARIMEQTGAPCWPPDAPSTGPCPVE
jgi:multiple sugar transport system substrate-binding protein